MTSEAPVERPTTSRGHRSRASNPLSTSTACALPAGSAGGGSAGGGGAGGAGGGGAYNAPISSTTTTTTSPRDSSPSGRPKTSHGRRPIVIPSPADNNPHSETTREEFYNPTAKRRESKADILRLEDNRSAGGTMDTRRRRSHHQQDMLNLEVTGYRVQDSSFYSHTDRTVPVKARHDIALDYSQFANTSQSFGYEGTERPRTSHGRRQRGRMTQQNKDSSQGGDTRPYQTEGADMEAYQSSNMDDGNTAGNHGGYGHQDFFGDSTEPTRPNSRRSSVPTGPSYNMTPSPPPYSPTGASQSRHRARQSFSGPSTQDYYPPYGAPSTPSQSSRPSSAASLSKYPILPRIGVKVSPRSVVKDSSTEPTQITAGSNDTITVTDTVQTLSLGENQLNEETTANSNLRKQTKEKSVNPPKPQPGKPSGNTTSSPAKPTPAKPILKQKTKTNPVPPSEPEPKTKTETLSPKSSPHSLLKPLKRNVHLAAEPKGKEAKVLLAIKLHNGQRVQRNFRPTDPLSTVINFAEVSAKVDYSGHELVCGAPRKVFKNLKMQIKDSGLENKTMLHLEYPDE